MNSTTDPVSGYFVVGGPVQPDRPAYVWRDADRELLRRLREREYCTVLAPPQSGKTSLMAQAAHRLRAEGTKVATLDLAEIGSRNLADDVGRWYYSFAYRVLRELRIRADLSSWWQEHGALTTMQRLRDFFLEIVLQATPHGAVIFLDRIDALARHPQAWEIFDAIRACFDARATEPACRRIAFVLMGCPEARRLLAARQDSLFTVSAAIALGDFTPEELRFLAAGLPLRPADTARIADRVWHWTEGHPYLSQKVLRMLSRRAAVEIASDGVVDDAVARLFFGRNAIREDAHLALLAAKLRERRPGYAARLSVLGRVCKGVRVAVDRTARAQRELLELGLLVEQDGVLAVRNRIYSRVFSPLWINRNLPVSWRDVAVAAAVAMLVVAVPVWYTQLLPRPYVAALKAEQQSFAAARDAWERLGMIPGFADSADRLYADYLVRQGGRARRFPEVERISQRLAQLPGGPERARSMLADFWDRRTNAMAQRGDRDAAILYALRSLDQPSRARQERLAELLGEGFTSLAATIRPAAPLVDLEISPGEALLTTLDEAHEVAVWRIGGREPERAQRLTLTAEEVRPLRRSRAFPSARFAKRLQLDVRVDHPQPRDVEVILRAPSGRQAVLRVADAAAGARSGEFRFDSRRNYGLLPLLQQSAAGTWTAFFSDVSAGQPGRLVSWQLSLDGVQARVAPGDAGGDDGLIPEPQPAASRASALGPEGRRALTWPVEPGVRGDIMVWDLARAAVMARIPRPAGMLAARFVLGHSAVLMLGERDLELRDAASGRLIGRLALVAGARTEPVISDNGRYLVLDADTGAETSALTLWDLNGLRSLGRIATGTPAEALAADPFGRYIAISDGDRFVRVWQARDQSLVAECEHPARPVGVAFDPSGAWLVTQDQTDTLRVWDFAAGCRSVLARPGNGRWQQAFSPDGDRLLAGNLSRGFELLSLPAGQRLGASLQPGMAGEGSAPAGRAARPRLLPSLGLAVTYDGRKAVKLWSLPGPASDSRVVLANGSGPVAVSAAAGQVAFGTAAGEVRMFDWAGAATLRPAADGGPGFIGHLSAVTRLAFDPAGRLVASGSLDGTIRVWEVQESAPRKFFATHGDGAVHDVVFLPVGNLLVSATRASVLVVDATSGAVAARLAIQAQRPDLEVSADGNWIYIGGDRRGVTRWNWRTGMLSRLAGSEQPVDRVALSRDGQLLATVGEDRVVRLWHPQAGASLRRTFTVPAPVDALWFAADGRRVFAQTGAWLHTLEADPAGVISGQTRALPDAGTLVEPAGDGRTLLLVSGIASGAPVVARLSESQSWASAAAAEPGKLAAAIAARLQLGITDTGEVRPANVTPDN
jgi:WD40 repeat protein/subtilisin-like proprotein convertase family protein